MVRPEHFEKEFDIERLEAPGFIPGGFPCQIVLVGSVAKHQVDFRWIFECKVRVKDLLEIFRYLLILANWQDVVLGMVVDNLEILQVLKVGEVVVSGLDGAHNINTKMPQVHELSCNSLQVVHVASRVI